MDREISFWLAVGLVAIASVALFKIFAAQPFVQRNLPAVTTVAAAI